MRTIMALVDVCKSRPVVTNLLGTSRGLARWFLNYKEACDG